MSVPVTTRYTAMGSTFSCGGEGDSSRFLAPLLLRCVCRGRRNMDGFVFASAAAAVDVLRSRPIYWAVRLTVLTLEVDGNPSVCAWSYAFLCTPSREIKVTD